MSKRTDLYDKINGSYVNYASGMLLANIPLLMLSNDYVKHICVAANAAIYNAGAEVEQANSMLDITKNQ
jgi:hypothetical protein